MRRKTFCSTTLVVDGFVRRLKTGPVASFFFVGLLILSAGCSDHNVSPKVSTFSGATMGTTYHVSVVPEKNTDVVTDLGERLQAVLDDVDSRMSTYKSESELSRLNRAGINQPITVSTPLMDVLRIAAEVHQLTAGAFDPTVGPLVDLWGFGPTLHEDRIPPASEIELLLGKLGFDAVLLTSADMTVTRVRDVSLDLSAVAKGYAADRVGELLASLGISNYMVEVGGEMALSGLSPRGTPWRIAVEAPVSSSREVQRVISLTGVGVATSGDYRNYFEKDGKRYSHTLDPRTGFPISHDLVSVTVVAKNSALADALATAFMVMGTEQAMALAQQYDIAIYTLSQRKGAVVETYSPAFKPYFTEAD